MPKNNGTPPPPKQERLATYARLWQEDRKKERPPRGYKALSTITGWNVNTIKSDIRRMNQTPPIASPPPSNGKKLEVAPVPAPLAPPTTQRKGFDWDGWYDNVGKLIIASLGQSLKGTVSCGNCGAPVEVVQDPKLALGLGRTFASMYSAKQGATRVQLLLAMSQPPPPPMDVNTADLIHAIRHLNEGRDHCAACRQPLNVIDAVFTSAEEVEGGGS